MGKRTDALRRAVLVATLPLAGCAGSLGDSGSGKPAGEGPSLSPDAPAPGDGPVGAGPVDEQACALPARRLVKLTPAQYDATVRPYLTYLWGHPRPPSFDWSSTVGNYGGRFSNDADRVDMAQVHVGRIFGGARKVAAAQTGDLALYEYGNLLYKDPARFRCPGATPDAACVRAFLDDWAARVFRRPLGPAELDRYVGFFEREAATFGPQAGFEQVVQAVLLSPSVLYRTEVGDPAATGDRAEMTPYEKAQAISYMLTDKPPDDALRAAAAAGELATKGQVAAHVSRLLAERPVYTNDRRDGAAGVGRFWSEYLQWDKVRDVSKGWRHADWGALQNAAPRETHEFVHHWFWDGDATVKSLLTADYSFVNAKLAAHYGIDGGPAADDVYERVTLPPERRGLLTQVSFLATYGKPWTPDIVHRGRFVRERLLCGTIPPPPAGVASAGVLPDDPGATHNEIVAMHAADPSCWQCHKKMDPLGRPFQSFDTVGRFRTVDDDRSFREDDPTKERPLGDLAGGISDTGDPEVKVEGALELVTALGESPAAARCVALHAYRYAHARRETKADACALRDHYAAFLAAGGDVREFLVSVTTADDFFWRRVK